MLAGCDERIGCCCLRRQEVYDDPSVCLGATVVGFAFGVVTVGPAYAQRRDGGLLPQEESGQVTAVGCLVKGTAVRGGKKDKYALARPRKGPVASVPEATCTADAGADALMLDNTADAGVNDSMLGRWVQIGGRLRGKPARTRTTFVNSTWRRSSWCRSSPQARRRHRPLSAGAQPQCRPSARPAPAPEPTPAPAAPAPEPPKTCRRRRATFRRLGWPGCSRWQGASCFVRSVSGDEIDAAGRTATEGTTAHAVAPFVAAR